MPRAPVTVAVVALLLVAAPGGPAVASPAADLLRRGPDAVRALATDLLGQHTLSSPTLILRTLLGSVAAPARHRALGAPLDELRAAIRDADALRARAVSPAVVDEPTLHAAALRVLSSAEMTLPALRRARETRGVPSRCGATGEMVFESFDCSIVVGAGGPNSYPAGLDPTLLVDLGGDDAYATAAVARGSVRVLIDVAGDDSYDSGPGPTQGLVLGQAVALLGVAVLLDASGDDSYTVTATGGETLSAALTVYAQGSSSAGAAVLADLEGRDRFSAVAESTGGDVRLFAQGYASHGLGALLDLGEDKRPAEYVARAVSIPPGDNGEPGLAQVGAQGSGDAGPAMLVGSRGDDLYVATAEGGSSKARAQGAATASGLGVLVDPSGDDRLSVDAISRAGCPLARAVAGPAVAIAQGGAAGGSPEKGIALLLDGDGNDERDAGARSEADVRIECSARAQAGDATVFGQGAATGPPDPSGPGGLAALVDLGQGADVNRLVAASTATVGAPTADGDATAVPAAAVVGGQGFSSMGSGLSLDGGGDDRYEAWASSVGLVLAGQRETTSRGPAVVRSHGHGSAGPALFVDLDGDDAYLADPAGSLAGNDRCWRNSPEGAGYDARPGGPAPSGCP